MPEKLLTINETAHLLDIPEEEVRQLAKKGDLPAYHVGGEFLRFRREQIEAIRNEIIKKTRVQKEKTEESRIVPVERVILGPEAVFCTESFQDKFLDFFYFYDFYIISLGIIFLILWFIVN